MTVAPHKHEAAGLRTAMVSSQRGLERMAAQGTAAKSNTAVSTAITIRVEPAVVAVVPVKGEMASWGT
jgi:hypothetical protein